ncbi:MAG: FAD-binding oxidoreductase [Patescibacteria group bacterium]
MDLRQQLERVVRGEVTDDPRVLDEHSEDTSIFKIMPKYVVYPKDTADVRALVRLANEQPGAFTLTARSAGTDMTGGPLSSSVVVNFTRHFNRVLETSPAHAVTEPGVYYRDFDKETLIHGAILPSYTASRELNTVGGMVANNSAGEKSLTYGKTARYVRKLKIVLQDGNEYEFKKLSLDELLVKKAEDNFEGHVYREMERIIKDNISLILREKPTVSKNSAGYYLWNVWDRAADTFDLTQLIVGSQGTLGFVTEITFDLVIPKQHSRMLVMFLRPRHMKELGDMVNTVLAEKPESFESYDDKTFTVMLKVLPKLLKRMGGNPMTWSRDFWPEIKMVLGGGIPKLVLMAEFTADTDAEAAAMAEEAERAVNAKYKVATHVTRSKEEGNKFWIIRRESFKLLRENIHGQHTAPFIDDISVLPEKLPEFLPELYSIMNEYKLTYTIAGHIGDGNFHIIPLMDFSRPDFKKIVDELSERVYKLVGTYGGSITGEHNDGLIRTPFLGEMFSGEMLALFKQTKDVFDLHRIFNPHKKVDPDKDLLFASIKKESH